jgi:hypothetical protein
MPRNTRAFNVSIAFSITLHGFMIATTLPMLEPEFPLARLSVRLNQSAKTSQDLIEVRPNKTPGALGSVNHAPKQHSKKVGSQGSSESQRHTGRPGTLPAQAEPLRGQSLQFASDDSSDALLIRWYIERSSFSAVAEFQSLRAPDRFILQIDGQLCEAGLYIESIQQTYHDSPSERWRYHWSAELVTIERGGATVGQQSLSTSDWPLAAVLPLFDSSYRTVANLRNSDCSPITLKPTGSSERSERIVFEQEALKLKTATGVAVDLIRK